MRKSTFLSKVIIFVFYIAFISSNNLGFAIDTQQEKLIKEYLYEEAVKYYSIKDTNSAKKAFEAVRNIDPDYRDTNKYIQELAQHIIKRSKPTTPPPTLAKNISATKDSASIATERRRIDLREEIRPSEIFINEGDSLELLLNKFERFLTTDPSVLTVKKIDGERLAILATKIGLSFLHVWDEAGNRYSLKFNVKQRPLPVTTIEKRFFQEAEEAGSIKFDLKYNYDVLSTGPKLREIKKGTKSYDYTARLYGDTAYGYYDSGTLVKGIGDSSQLNQFWIKLLNGNIGGFKNFNLRGGDNTDFSIPDLILPSANFRGFRFDTQTPNNRLKSLVFWGQERYYFLFPGLGIKQSPESYLYGTSFDFPVKTIDLRLTYLGAYGSERKQSQAPKNASVQAKFKFSGFDWWLETNFDGEDRAFLVKSTYQGKNYKVNGAFRNVAKQYATLIGPSPDQGERGFLLTAIANPFPILDINAKFDIYQDRLFPRPNKPDVANMDLNINANLKPFKGLSASFDYNRMDDKGKLFPVVYDTLGVTLRERFKFIKEFFPYIRYQNQKNINLTLPTSDFRNNKVLVGIQTYIIPNLSIDISNEWDWLKETYYGDRSSPARFIAEAYYDSDIKNTPFHFRGRFRYVKERNAQSLRSSLTGEDTREGQIELTYKPANGLEAYINLRAADYKAIVERRQDRVEFEFKSGFRGLFDIGVKFAPSCNIIGIVFLDSNGDGQLQEDEPLIEGIKLYAGKRHTFTNSDGYYEFKKIKGRTAYVLIDSPSIPEGYVVTTPLKQTVDIVNGATITVNFGVAAVSEVWGVVYNDVNGNSEIDPDDVGLANICIFLDSRTKVLTDKFGRYRLIDIVPGTHEIKLDINSVPLDFLPQGPVVKIIEIKEADRIKVDFPLHANRWISGIVYVDSNKNGVFDSGDFGIAGVKLVLDGEFVVSDKDGKFLFKQLKPGKFALKIDKSSVPSDYILSGKDFVEINIPKEAMQLKGIDFKLEKK